MLDTIAAAVLTGVAASVGKVVASKVVEDAYNRLKSLLARKLGKESDAVEALAKLEKQPERDDRKATVIAELQAANVGEDAELLAAAERLQAAIATLPEDAQAGIQHAVGNYIAQASGGSTATVHVFRDFVPPAPASLVRRSSQNDIDEASRTDADYPVWYGTNRKPIDPLNPKAGYSSIRDTRVHRGVCRVFIPESHKIGSIGSPWWKRLLKMTDDRLRLLSIEAQQLDVFWQSISAHLGDLPMDEQTAVIFVHGYNVSFEEAALRAAQIGFDLSIKGTMAFFSWPSRGAVGSYLADAATIEASEDAIADFMTDFVEKSGAKTVHIIAHSMGNRGVLRAVNRIAAQAQQRTNVKFGQIILAAADVDADVFQRLSAAYAQVASRTTLYVSKRDLAIEASQWLHDFPRAGLLPPILVSEHMDTINVMNADLTMLGHGYVADARDVLQDMYDLFVHNAPPAKRFSLRKALNEKGQPFWLIGA